MAKTAPRQSFRLTDAMVVRIDCIAFVAKCAIFHVFGAARIGASPGGPTAPSKGRQLVLIIDDDSDMREMLLDMLAEAGIAATAAGPPESLRMLDVVEPDVVLLDVLMPIHNGYDVLRYIRSRPRRKQPFVIVVSAHGRREHLQVSFDGGADDFVAKPFAYEELVVSVERGLQAVGSASGG